MSEDTKGQLTAEESRSFALLVARVWADDEAARDYAERPHAVLAEYGIQYSQDVPAPAIPDCPEMDVSIEDLSLVAGMGPTLTSHCASTLSTLYCGGTCAGSAACVYCL